MVERMPEPEQAPESKKQKTPQEKLKGLQDEMQEELTNTSWKYADPEKAKKFKNEFPEINATNDEIEDAAYTVYMADFKLREYFRNKSLEECWKDPFFLRLMKMVILEKRAR